MEESLTFRDRFYDLFVTNDKLRWAALTRILVTGGLAGSLMIVLNASIDDVVEFLALWVILGFIVTIAWYCSFSLRQLEAVPSLPRRMVLQFVSSTIAFLFMLRLPRAEAFAIDRQLQESADKPITSESLREVTEILSKAKDAKIIAGPTTVQRVGHQLLRAANYKPEAWDAAINCVNYKSFLNTALTFQYRTIGRLGEQVNTDYDFETPPGTVRPLLSVFGAVPYADAAIWRHIGAVDPNEQRGRANDWIIAHDGGIMLDGMQAKRMICINCTIVYNGGPVKLENVFFISCTFSVKHENNGERLITALLNPAPQTNFSTL